MCKVWLWARIPVLPSLPKHQTSFPAIHSKWISHWKEEGAIPFPAKSMEYPVLLRTLAPLDVNMCACVSVRVCVCMCACAYLPQEQAESSEGFLILCRGL